MKCGQMPLTEKCRRSPEWSWQSTTSSQTPARHHGHPMKFERSDLWPAATGRSSCSRGVCPVCKWHTTVHMPVAAPGMPFAASLSSGRTQT
nr:hypothetical protein CFP56_29900 [Quercus suber]